MRCFSDLITVGKSILIAHVCATRPVDACDEGILIRFACLDVRSVHTRVLAPLLTCRSQKRRAIVRPNALRQAMLTCDGRKDAHQLR